MAKSARRPNSHADTPALDNAIAAILTEGTPSPMIYRAARTGSEAIKIMRPTQVVSIRDTIIRIQQEADPIGFLMGVMQGAVFETPLVMEEATINEVTGESMKQLKEVRLYESPTMKQRIEAAKFLANKVLPSLSVQQVQIRDETKKDAEQEDAAYNPMGEPGQPTFAQLVHMAAAEAQMRAVEMAPRVIVQDDVADGRAAYIGSAGDGEIPDDIDLGGEVDG